MTFNKPGLQPERKPVQKVGVLKIEIWSEEFPAVIKNVVEHIPDRQRLLQRFRQSIEELPLRKVKPVLFIVVDHEGLDFFL